MKQDELDEGIKTFAAWAALSASLIVGAPNVARAQEPGAVGTASTVAVSTVKHADIAVRGALTMLDQIGVHPRSTIIVTGSKPKNATATVQGMSFEGNPNIYIPNWSDLYKQAKEGKQIAQVKMAAVIAHEQMHLDNPAGGERAAYDAQLDVLRKLNAPHNVIQVVENSKASALKSSK